MNSLDTDAAKKQIREMWLGAPTDGRRSALPMLLDYLTHAGGVGLANEDEMALELVAWVGGPDAEDFLINLLQTHVCYGDKTKALRSPGFRDDIALVLARLGCTRAIPAITNHVVDYLSETSWVRGIAALGRLKAIDAIPILATVALKHPDSLKRSEAARSLRLIDPELAIPVLVEGLNCTADLPSSRARPSTRDNAVVALFIVNTPAALRHITRSTSDKLLGRKKWIDKVRTEAEGNAFLASMLKEEEHIIARASR